MYKVICKIPNKHVGNRKLKSEYKADLVLQNKTHHFVLEKIIDVDFEEI
jgi:hypothetical protein|tara:strand:- start:389 stop:535 length:147 start_codon:yes stop_codon:yes gene_type:complete